MICRITFILIINFEKEGFNPLTKLDLETNTAARLEWSSFFAMGKAWQKKAGTEGG
ncbi:hypothetical protein PQ459_03120 [Chryseobacterium sp. KACC 21268]|nr:hypothetical protein PQ459_03120 [Chryseobacterium sp. KACC 21268]